MINIMDWLLKKTRLVEEEDEEIEVEESVRPDKTWLELRPWRIDKKPFENHHVYFKSIQLYDDCKLDLFSGNSLISERGMLYYFIANL